MKISRCQSGTALIFALIILAALTMVGIASVNTGMMELRIARSYEDQIDAFQLSQSMIDYTISDQSNLPTTGPLKTPVDVTLNGPAFDVTNGDDIDAHAERVIDCGQPPRVSSGSSLLAFSSFSYKIYADVDKSANERGQSYQRQGYLTLGPKC